MRHSRAALVLTALSLLPAVMAQPPSASPKLLTFDAASIKPWGGPGSEVSDGTGKTIARKQTGMVGNMQHPGRAHYFGSLRRLLATAYDLDVFQIQGEDWSDTIFVVDAIMPRETTKEQSRLMLQNLLVERFKLATHRGTKETSGHALEVAKSGPRLAETTGDLPETEPPANRPRNQEFLATLGPDGFPKAPAWWSPNAIEQGYSMYTSPIGWKVFFHARTMHDLADYLWERTGSPVVDNTSLTSRYDFSLTYLPDDAPPPSGILADRFRPAPNISQALESQLGLNFEKRKVTVEMLIIDHTEKTPTEN